MTGIPFLAALLLATAAFAAESVVAPGAQVEKLADGFAFTEGPTCDGQGNVYFTDQPSNRIMRWSVEGQLSTFLQPAGRANGMCFDQTGQLIACADEKNELWSIAPDGKHTVLAQEFEGKPLNGPNDVWIAPNGGMYLSDPYYQRPWWAHKAPPQSVRAVFYRAPAGGPLRRVAEDLTQPNGVAGTADGKRLYVSDINAKKTYRYDIQPDGSLRNRQLHCEIGSDGMTVDSEGNLYLTNGQGVSVVDPTGQLIEVIKVPEKHVANVCFGGKDRKTLFITAVKGLYAVKTRVAAANPAK